MTEQTTFRAEIDGFVKTNVTMQEVQAWWDDLKAKHNFSGKTLKIYKGTTTPGSNWATYSSKPAYQQVVA